WIDDRKSVEADSVRSILRVAAWAGDAALLGKARGAAVKAEGYDKSLLLGLILDINDADVLGQASDLLLSDEFRAGDFRHLRTLRQTGAARPVLFHYVRENLDALTAKLGAGGATSLLLSGRTLCDPESLEQYQQFFADRAPRMLGGPRRYAAIAERIELCI